MTTDPIRCDAQTRINTRCRHKATYMQLNPDAPYRWAYLCDIHAHVTKLRLW